MLSSYQILFVNADGQVYRVVGRACADDEEAAIWLGLHGNADACALELWSGGRHIKTQRLVSRLEDEVSLPGIPPALGV